MANSTRSKLKGIIAVLFVVIIFTQIQLDPQIREIHKGEKTAFQGLSNEFILGPMLGLQEAVAGALWVRADEFFHEGDYDAILPIVRMVTWLDPHQLDVYITGAWHLAYNFTDSNERSDRRYIPASQKLLEEGDANNTRVYDIAFELGWQNNDKIKDFDRSEFWFRTASTRKGSAKGGEPTEPAPLHVRHMLAHSMEKQGRIEAANDVWRSLLAETEPKLKATPDDFSLKSLHDSEKHNLKLNLERMFSRYTHRINFDLEGKTTRSVNMVTGEPDPKDCFLSLDPAKDGAPVGQPRPPATSVPWKASFDTVRNGHTTILFPQPRVMDIKGIFNMGDGSRVAVKLHDDNFRESSTQTFTFDIDQSQTIMMDSLAVRGAQWGRKIDMSKDPKMYSFSRPAYYLVLSFDPRSTAPFIQDRIGWSGEGMANPKYEWIVKSNHPELGKKDDKIIRKVYRITREQIMGTKPVSEADVIPNDLYDKIQAEQNAPMVSAPKSAGE